MPASKREGEANGQYHSSRLCRTFEKWKRASSRLGRRISLCIVFHRRQQGPSLLSNHRRSCQTTMISRSRRARKSEFHLRSILRRRQQALSPTPHHRLSRQTSIVSISSPQPVYESALPLEARSKSSIRSFQGTVGATTSWDCETTAMAKFPRS